MLWWRACAAVVCAARTCDVAVLLAQPLDEQRDATERACRVLNVPRCVVDVDGSKVFSRQAARSSATQRRVSPPRPASHAPPRARRRHTAQGSCAGQASASSTASARASPSYTNSQRHKTHPCATSAAPAPTVATCARTRSARGSASFGAHGRIRAHPCGYADVRRDGHNKARTVVSCMPSGSARATALHCVRSGCRRARMPARCASLAARSAAVCGMRYRACQRVCACVVRSARASARVVPRSRSAPCTP